MNTGTVTVGAPPEVKATKRLSHQDQVLGMLKRGGAKGCTTEQLCEVTHRFSARISDLKAKGWDIETVGRAGTDSCHYILKGTVDKPAAQPSMMQLQAPAPPSSGLVTGICECHHPRAWHLKAHGQCNACDCTTYVSE